jgi:hypothetical protein
MRWTRACRLTSGMDADGGGVWSWHPWAGAKSRGFAMSTLTGATRWDPRGDGDYEVTDTGESTHNAVTPLRREGRVAPVEPVVTNSCAFYTAHEAAGAAGTRSSLRPLFRGGTCIRKARANCVAGTRTCVLSSLRAQRSNPELRHRFRIASSLALLAMTNAHSASSHSAAPRHSVSRCSLRKNPK